MVVPEIIIFNTLESIVKLIRKDLVYVTSDKDTLLYKILGTDEEGGSLKMNLYDYYKQAKKMFSVQDNLSVNFGYNQKVAKNLSLHILLPSEQGKVGIGSDEGYMEEEERDANGNLSGVNTYHTQTFDSNYQIMITSNNSAEINVVYNVLKSMLLILIPQLELRGLRLPSISGGDIVMQDDLTPVPLFHKVLNISFQYEHNVPTGIVNAVMRKFHFEMNAIDLEANIEQL